MPERRDAYGMPTTSPAAAMGGIDDFVTGFVGYHPRAVNVLETAEAHPDSALANTLAGFLWMFLERPEAPEKAAPWEARAAACTGLNRRERGLLALLDAWRARDARRALAIAEDILADHPGDLATLKIGQYHAFNLGDAPAMLRLALGSREAADAHAPFHSVLAFAREECGELAAAERAAGRALELDADEPWAHHAFSHTYLTRGEVDAGRRFLTEHAPSWRGLNSFMYTHNFWHLALFEIAAGEGEAALRTFDERVWGVEPDYSQDQVNAISLLARLECADVDVGDRWRRMAPHLLSRADDVVQPFVTLHYLYGLARAEAPEADTLLALIERQEAQPEVPADRALWRAVGIPAAQGLVAHARGEHDAAVELLSRVGTRWWMTGGSHAQRELFERLHLEAKVRAECWTDAHAPLVALCRREPDDVALGARLARARARLGLDALH